MSVRSRQQLAAESQRFLSMVSAHEQQLAVMANDLGLDRRDAISKQSSHRDVDLRLSAEEKARLLGRGIRANHQNRPSPWADFQAPAVADSSELEDLNDGQTWRINRAAQASALGGHMGNGAAVPAFARNQGRPFAQFSQPTPPTTSARGVHSGRRGRGSSHLSRAERNTILPPPVSNYVPAAPPRGGSHNQRGRSARAARPPSGLPLSERIVIPAASNTARKITNPINVRSVTPNGPKNGKIAPLWAPLLQGGRPQAPRNKVSSPPRNPGFPAEFPFRVTQARIARDQAASQNPYPKPNNENFRPVQPPESESSPKKTMSVPTPAPTPVRSSLLGSHNYRPNIMDMDEPVTSLPPPLMPIVPPIMTPITTPMLTPISMTSPHIGDSAMSLQGQYQLESQPDHHPQAQSETQHPAPSPAQVPTLDFAPASTEVTPQNAITSALEELATKIRGFREEIAYAAAILEEEELGDDERRDVEEGLQKLQTIRGMYVKRQAELKDLEQSLAEDGEIVK